MGFYAPAQLVADARRHAVEVLPVDVTVSEWDCTLETKSDSGSDTTVQRTGRPTLDRDEKSSPTPLPPGVARVERSETRGNRSSEAQPRVSHSLNPGCANPGPALRLGLRLVAGLTEAGAQRTVAARRGAPFSSVADLAHRAGLNKRDLALLGDAGALAALAGHRHAAVWDVAGIERLPPLLAGSAFNEVAPVLPPPTEGQDIVADYRTLGLTLRRHPLALLRDRLRQRRLLTAADIGATPHGRIVRTAGIVIGRQRPDTASGVIFVTLEDETGATNVIVWRDLGDRQRRELLGAKLLAVFGKVEREGPVVHVLAGKLADLSPLLGELPARSRDFH